MVGFNPLPHAEGDPLNFAIRMPTRCFNPLPHAEGDPAPFLRHQDRYCFNPLPHAEGDKYRGFRQLCIFVSIHSLTQRETWPAGFVWFLWRCFNPLPHAEGDYEHGRLEGLRLCFNPLPHAEGDTASISSSLVGNAFQSTPSRRGRRFL